MSIAPGDLLIGDEDGVLVVPRDEVAGILGPAEAKYRTEQVWEREIAQGTWDRRWVDEALAKL